MNSVLLKSRSEDRLDAPEAQSTERNLTGRSVSTYFSDSNASAAPSKFTSREAVVKSQKPATKPLHLGKSFCLYELSYTRRVVLEICKSDYKSSKTVEDGGNRWRVG